MYQSEAEHDYGALLLPILLFLVFVASVSMIPPRAKSWSSTPLGKPATAERR
jgi:hypothetical protein